MTLALIIDGESRSDLWHAIAFGDRGFSYGDGVFETALLSAGRIRFFDDHLARLRLGCERLGFSAPSADVLTADVERSVKDLHTAVVKIIVTRGVGGRGYRPPANPTPSRVIAVYAAPEPFRDGAMLRWCDTRLARNPQLAGVKHLNRLEQVLAQAEWRDSQIDEGLMLDTEGELVCGTASNVFVVRDGVLCTPDLRFCGVRGVMRRQVLRAAEQAGVAVNEAPLWPHDLEQASEVFLTSALRGVQSVAALDELRWTSTTMAAQLRKALSL